MVTSDEVACVYSDIHERIFGVEYTFSNAKVLKALQQFTAMLPEFYDKRWVENFIIFQFSYYKNAHTRFTRVYVNWILGQAAIERFAKKTDTQKFYADKFRTELGIRDNFCFVDVSAVLDRQRRIFGANKGKQLLFCLDEGLSTLPFSKVCEICVSSPICSMTQ